ncbi:hypothetical protein VPHK397_0217 [Vibrio phage K397]
MIDNIPNTIANKPKADLEWFRNEHDFMSVEHGRFGASSLLSPWAQFSYTFPTSDRLTTGDFSISFWYQNLGKYGSGSNIVSSGEVFRLVDGGGNIKLALIWKGTELLLSKDGTDTSLYGSTVTGLDKDVKYKLHEKQNQITVIRESRTLKLFFDNQKTILTDVLPADTNLQGYRLEFHKFTPVREYINVDRLRIHNRALNYIEVSGLYNEPVVRKANFKSWSDLGLLDFDWSQERTETMYGTIIKCNADMTISANRFRGFSSTGREFVPFIAKMAPKGNDNTSDSFGVLDFVISSYLYHRKDQPFPVGNYDEVITFPTPIELKKGDYILVGNDAMGATASETSYGYRITKEDSSGKMAVSNASHLMPIIRVSNGAYNKPFGSRIGDSVSTSDYGQVYFFDLTYSTK